MLGAVNMLYRSDSVTTDIINALSTKLESCEDGIDDIYKQIFLEFATWYLEIKENEMSISDRATDLDTRRDRIKTRLLGVGTATKELLESTANSISGIEVEISFENMCVIANFTQADSTEILRMAESTLKEMIPYHLDIAVNYHHILWDEVKKVTWGDVFKCTWNSLANDVEGTLINSE